MEREGTDTLTPRETSLSHPGLGLHPKAGAEDEHGAVKHSESLSALSSEQSAGQLQGVPKRASRGLWSETWLPAGLFSAIASCLVRWVSGLF